MKIADIRILGSDELAGAEHNVRRQIFEARMARATGELADTMHLRRLRRDLARILTVSGERRAGADPIGIEEK